MWKQVAKQLDSVVGAITRKEAEWLYVAGSKNSGKGVIAEIGSFQGMSTICLAHGSKDKVYAIDPHLGSKVVSKKFSGPTYANFLHNLQEAKVSDRVIPIKKFSFEASRSWKKPIKFLFIDGNHTYAAVGRDLLEWEPWVIPGGTIALHDALNPAQGVSRAIVKYLLDTKKLASLGVVDSIFYGIKAGRKNWRDKMIEAGIRLTPRLLRSGLPGMRQYVVKRWLKQWLTFLTRLK